MIDKLPHTSASACAEVYTNTASRTRTRTTPCATHCSCATHPPVLTPHTSTFSTHAHLCPPVSRAARNCCVCLATGSMRQRALLLSCSVLAILACAQAARLLRGTSQVVGHNLQQANKDYDFFYLVRYLVARCGQLSSA